MKKANKSKVPFIYRLIEMQGNIKLYHWLTYSYNKHKASEKLYEKLSDKIDKFVEAYIGIYGRPIIAPNVISVFAMKDEEMIDYLTKAKAYIMKELPINYERDSDLSSILDDIVSAINKALYLFTMS